MVVLVCTLFNMVVMVVIDKRGTAFLTEKSKLGEDEKYALVHNSSSE